MALILVGSAESRLKENTTMVVGQSMTVAYVVRESAKDRSAGGSSSTLRVRTRGDAGDPGLEPVTPKACRPLKDDEGGSDPSRRRIGVHWFPVPDPATSRCQAPARRRSVSAVLSLAATPLGSSRRASRERSRAKRSPARPSLRGRRFPAGHSPRPARGAVPSRRPSLRGLGASA
jgi:hypothetical protein